MAETLADTVIERHRKRLHGRARLITIDLDPTNDPSHGAQQLMFFNWHYDTYCYLPVVGFLTFNQEAEQYLVTAVLRPGNAPGSVGHVRSPFERLRQKRVGKGAVPIRVEGPIFTGKGGERLLSAKHWFLRAVKTASVAGFTWHDLRHTFASRLVMSGADIVTVKELLGHQTLSMTVRYSHLAPEYERVAVERMSRYNSQSS
jgi:hypothetical protein